MVKQYLVETPITSLLPYPLNTIFQSKSLGEAFPKVKGGGVTNHPLELSHTLGKGFPHNLGFPSNEQFGNVSNGFLCGVGLVKWL